jgi:hypothetical protein
MPTDRLLVLTDFLRNLLTEPPSRIRDLAIVSVIARLPIVASETAPLREMFMTPEDEARLIVLKAIKFSRQPEDPEGPGIETYLMDLIAEALKAKSAARRRYYVG